MWREAPSLRVKLMPYSASVLDRKIYVSGRSKDGNGYFKNWCEVFDTITQVWDAEPLIPCSQTKYNFYKCESACVDGKFHVATTHREVVAYDSKKGRWDQLGREIGEIMISGSYCEIENVLYFAYFRAFFWYDTEVRKWRILWGLVGLPGIPPLSSVILADYGGKIAVLWDDDNSSCSRPAGKSEKMIWCAVIALERRHNSDIWGKVEWFDHVLTVPLTCNFVKGLAATV